jgi:hypothetical protein
MRRLRAAGLACILVLGLSGCLQDAYNANKDFVYNNPLDPTPISTTQVTIAWVDLLSNTVVIVNGSGIAQTLTGWTLVRNPSAATPTSFTIPAVTLAVGGFVRIHADTTHTTNTTLDIYSDGITWVPTDIAELNNAASPPVAVFVCTVGTTC